MIIAGICCTWSKMHSKESNQFSASHCICLADGGSAATEAGPLVQLPVQHLLSDELQRLFDQVTCCVCGYFDMHHLGLTLHVHGNIITCLNLCICR